MRKASCYSLPSYIISIHFITQMNGLLTEKARFIPYPYGFLYFGRKDLVVLSQEHVKC